MPENEFLDGVKICLALMVVAIHSQLSLMLGGVNVFFPWLRISVPLFFIMSGFFFFSCKSEHRLWTFTLRNYGMYLFYAIVFSPMLMYTHFNEYFKNGIFAGLCNFLLTMLWYGDAFAASWFIIALIYGVLSVYLVGRFLGNIVAIALGAALYVPVYLSLTHNLWDVVLPLSMEAIVFVAIGKMFADGFRLSRGKSIVGLILSGLVLFAEWYYIFLKTGRQVEDCLLSLIPFSFFSFALFLTIRMKIPHARSLRRASATIYFTHFSVIILARGCVRLLNIDYPPAIAMFCVGVTGALMLGCLVNPIRDKFIKSFVNLFIPYGQLR